VLSLDLGDVTLERGREGLLVREAKTNRDRVVVLMPDLMPKVIQGRRACLKALGQRAAATLPLFASNRGTRLSYDALHGSMVAWHFKLVLAKAGVPIRTRFYDLRHTAATLLLAEGVPLVTVSKILGHSSPAITATIYARALDEQKASAIAALSARFRKAE
jgi:integrase